MKKCSFLLLAMLAVFTVFGQRDKNPVTWTFTTKKISDKVYEVHMTATMQSGWHVYSQTQPKDAIAQPTTFAFNKNPLLELDGKVKEVGKMEKFVDKELDISANQYSQKVTFVQKVKLKGSAKSNVGGTVEFQACTDEECLPAKKVSFNVSLN